MSAVVAATPTSTSQHSRVLRAANLVVGRRRGNVVYYRLHSGEQARMLEEILQTCDGGHRARK